MCLSRLCQSFLKSSVISSYILQMKYSLEPVYLEGKLMAHLRTIDIFDQILEFFKYRIY